MTSTRSVQIALLGCGTVGAGVLKLLRDNAEHLAARAGVPLEVKHVLVKNAGKERGPECRGQWLTTDPDLVLGDPAVDVVVEVMGGEQPARRYVERAIDAGKSVVSANKLLLATAGSELVDRASAKNVDLAFEASVGGGIPVIRTLRDALTSDRVLSLHAILNGTCNYILTRMRSEGLDFASVLVDAQRLGYAESEPSLDVDGHDAAQKLVVLAMLAFAAQVDIRDVWVEGIRQIDETDFRFADRFGFTIKHLAIGYRRQDGVELRVHPAMVPDTSVLANIHDVLNGAFIQGSALGPCLLVGPGAGSMPTAVSVVADIVDVARSRVEGIPGLATKVIQCEKRRLLPMTEVDTRYYLRFDVADEPGVLAHIASALGRQGVSVEQMVQDGRAEAGGDVAVVMITHRSKEGSIARAIEEVRTAKFLKRPPRLLRIEDVG